MPTPCPNSNNGKRDLSPKSWVKRFVSIAKIGFVFMFGLMLIFQSQETVAAPPRQGPPQAPSVVRGAALWPTNCAPCHGTTGLGDGPTAAALDHPPTNFTDVALARERTLAEMVEVTTNGRIERLMPPWNNRLTEQEIWDVVLYAQSFSGDQATLDQGEAVYAQSCAACHGVEGVATDIDLTSPTLLINTSDQTLFTQLRTGQVPHDVLTSLSDDDIWQSIAFIRTLSLDKPVLDGQITGFLRNGTTGDVLPNTPVILYALSPIGDILDSYSTQSDETGQFTFTDLNVDHTLSYVLEGSYQGLDYLSPEPILFLPEVKEVTQDLLLFEVTDDATVVTQQRFHRIMVFEADQIRLADVYVFEATGDQTYIGQTVEDGQLATLKVSLPADAFSVQFQDQSIRGFEDYYLSRQPVIPDRETFVSVQYSLPFVGSDVRLETPLYYEVGAINVLAADIGQTIVSDLLESEGTQTFQGNTYQLLRGANPQADQPLVMEITNIDVTEIAPPVGRPPNAIVPETVGQDQSLLLYSLLGLGAAMLIFSLVYSRSTSVEPVNEDAFASEKQYLLTLLAELERQYQAEEIEATVYHKLRAQNRAKLKQILGQHKGILA